jgi:MFS family permease
LIYNLFSDERKRTKALGTCAFVGACGGSLGLLLGGALTSTLGWRWVFFANVPVGLGIWVLCWVLIPRARVAYVGRSLDIPGALLGTTATMMALYAIVNGNRVGWSSPQTLIFLAVAVMLVALFITIEARAPVPLMPLELFRIRNVAVANILSTLFAGAVFGWSFLTTLYLQTVLHFRPFEVGVTFLPANVLTALMSLTVTPWLVSRLGIRTPLVSGLLIACAGLAFLARVPVNGSVWADVIPAAILLGLGTGMAYNPLFVGALGGVGPKNSGAASGILNTAFALGGALGVSVLASIAAASREHWSAAGSGIYGYRAGFCSGAVLAAVAALIAGCSLRSNALPHGCSAAKEAV